MKYISPGGWFSLEYPMGWHEFEDTEESFLFYNPDRWTGNFRISAYKDEAADYGPQCIAYELKENTSSTLVKVGKWDCAYSAETFQEEGAWYTTHIWVTGEGDLSFECSFTVSKGGDKHPAEEIIRSLQISYIDIEMIKSSFYFHIVLFFCYSISIFCPRCVNDTKRTPCASAKSRKAFALAYSGVKCMGTKI